MVKYFKKKFPYINLVGYYSPPFKELTTEEKKSAIDSINILNPDIIFVGLGTPKQDYWIDENIEKIRGGILVTCGATFDFFGGRIKMAPKWTQKAGFEWLFRLFSKDFKRLWERYTIMNIKFLFLFFLQIICIRKYKALRKPKL
jgi:N-acetylglucosaminyldiphosphoundecaprenol N-acetyl-beta-D-mannosaminyltransferase